VFESEVLAKAQKGHKELLQRILEEAQLATSFAHRFEDTASGVPTTDADDVRTVLWFSRRCIVGRRNYRPYFKWVLMRPQ